jgi:hypothetical protein
MDSLKQRAGSRMKVLRHLFVAMITLINQSRTALSVPHKLKIALTLGIIVAFLSRPLIARMRRRLRHVDCHGSQESPRDHAKPVH